MGIGLAAVVATRMESVFNFLQIRLLVGVGGGVPSAGTDVRLGDVVISQPQNGYGGVVQYDFGKARVDGDFQRTSFLNAPPRILLDAITTLRTRIIRQKSQIWGHLAAFGPLQDFSREKAGPDILFHAESTHTHGATTCESCDRGRIIHRAERPDQNPIIHYGTIASGNQVIKDAIARDRRSKNLGGVLCFEMEAAGLMNDFPCIVIRGICDYALTHTKIRPGSHMLLQLRQHVQRSYYRLSNPG